MHCMRTGMRMQRERERRHLGLVMRGLQFSSESFFSVFSSSSSAVPRICEWIHVKKVGKRPRYMTAPAAETTQEHARTPLSVCLSVCLSAIRNYTDVPRGDEGGWVGGARGRRGGEGASPPPPPTHIQKSQVLAKFEHAKAVMRGKVSGVEQALVEVREPAPVEVAEITRKARILMQVEDLEL